MKRVEVTWCDSHQMGAGWLPKGAATDDGPCTITSIGWLVKPGKKGHVTLAMSHNPHSSEMGLHNVFCIPLGMVKKVRRL